MKRILLIFAVLTSMVLSSCIPSTSTLISNLSSSAVQTNPRVSTITPLITSSATMPIHPTNSTNPVTETYYIFGVIGDQNLTLKTINSWNGTGNQVLDFSVTRPSVINYSYSNSSLGSFDWGIQGGNSGDYAKLGSSYWDRPMSPERQSGSFTFGSMQLSETGTFRLKINSAGCQWHIKLGTQ